jgi:hypothetical protein
MFDYQEKPEYELTPQELQQTLIGFLGSTYKEVAQIDNYLVQPNQTLRPIKRGFQDLAQRVIDETVRPNVPQQTQQNVQYNNQPVLQPVPQNILQPQTLQQRDPNQLEFSFDNSITAKTIFNKLDDLEKKIKKIDIAISKVLEYIETNDTENSKQN